MDFAPMLVYIAVASFTPGPNNLMTMYLSANNGFKSARRFIIGSAIAYESKILLCGALNVVLAETVPMLVPYLKWIGAAYMLYLAVHMLLDGFKKREASEPSGGESTYRSGVLLQVLNMKSWVFALSLFSIYVVPRTTSFMAVLVCALIAWAFMITATLLWGLCGGALRSVYEKHSKPFSVVMAASLVWCAITALK